MKFSLVFLVLLILTPAFSAAHEVRPGFMEITEQAPNTYKILWKAPGRVGMIFKINPVLPGECTDLVPVSRRKLVGSYIEHRVIDCGEEGLAGREIIIEGLSETITDVLVRVTHSSGRSQTELLKPHRPGFTVLGNQSWYRMAGSYINMGVNHILHGIDHLLFVLGLLLLSRGWMLLIKTITAFTVGHSLSLALATLGFITVPGPPLTAAIALSIVFLAGELVRAERGDLSLTIRNPWLVSFGFGLLHGLGFAGALVSLGLPQTDILTALLFFNIGVEIGQVLFVVLILLLAASLRKVDVKLPDWSRRIPVYAMGTIAGFWFVGRFVALF